MSWARMLIEFEIVGCSDVGRVRKQNQDWLHVDQRRGFFVLADGVGGGPGGKVASHLAVETITRILEGELDRRWFRVRGRTDQARLQVMREAVSEAHQALRRRSEQQPQLQGMATTLLAGVLGAGRCLCVSVGDSRLYRATSQGLEQVTRDQTLANRLLADGFLEPDDPRLKRYQHVLTGAVGGAEEPQPQSLVVTLQEGHSLLACSDGLSGMLEDRQIVQLLANGESLQQSAAALVAGANEAGGRDNISVVLAATRGRGLLPLVG